MALPEVLKRRRKELGLTLKEIADKMNVSEATVQRWESGNIKNLRRNRIGELAEVLDISPAEFFGYEPATRDAAGEVLPANIIPLPKMKKVPILGEIACGEPIYAEEQYGEFAEVDIEVNCDFALTAKGDSMIDAGIKNGYLVFIRRQDTVNDGEIAAVILDDEATLKRVRRIPGGITMLEPCNAAHDPIYIGAPGETRTVRVLGKAVAFQGYL